MHLHLSVVCTTHAARLSLHSTNTTHVHVTQVCSLCVSCTLHLDIRLTSANDEWEDMEAYQLAYMHDMCSITEFKQEHRTIAKSMLPHLKQVSWQKQGASCLWPCVALASCLLERTMSMCWRMWYGSCVVYSCLSVELLNQL